MLVCLGALSQMVVRGFDADGKTDLLWHHPPSGQTAVWFMNWTNFSGRVGWLTNDIDRAWRPVATADFNRDSHTDLLWRRADTGQNEIWLMHGTNRLARQEIARGGPEFHLVATGDFNGDGHDDLLWHRPAGHYLAAWLMHGTNWTGEVRKIAQPAEPGWTAVSAADWDGDGYGDVLFRNRTSGRNLVLLLEDGRESSRWELPPEPAAAFELIGAAPFTPLPIPDLIWRQTNGQYRVWLMNATKRTAMVPLPDVSDTHWCFVGAGGSSGLRLPIAKTSETPPQIIVSWFGRNDRPATLDRRISGAEEWSRITENYLPRRWTNSDVALGQRYEFKLGDSFLVAGLNATAVEERGTALLVIERSLLRPLRRELEQFERDLIGDGWKVIQTHVARHDDQRWTANTNAIGRIKSFIRNAHRAHPDLKTVILIGHVPVPYSGCHNPDGHGSRALPADLYYGDLDGLYTDRSIDFSSQSEIGIRSGEHRHDNFRLDGRFDQVKIPVNASGVDRLELSVGRIDFANLPAFRSLNETELLRRYFEKNHRYRHGRLVFRDAVMIGSFFHPEGPHPLFWPEALRNASGWLAGGPAAIITGDPLQRDATALWGLYAAWGWPHGMQGIDWHYHTSEDLAKRGPGPKVAFFGLYGSYFVDFDYKDNLLRGITARPEGGLGAFWFPPNLAGGRSMRLESLGLGDTIGNAFVRSINENRHRMAANLHLAYLGDPTLRLQVLPSPGELTVRAADRITLSWPQAPDPDVRFWVYRSATDWAGPWVKLTAEALDTNQFTDNAPPGAKVLYQVRALKRTTTASGSFTNLSQGVFARATNSR